MNPSTSDEATRIWIEQKKREPSQDPRSVYPISIINPSIGNNDIDFHKKEDKNKDHDTNTSSTRKTSMTDLNKLHTRLLNLKRKIYGYT